MATAPEPTSRPEPKRAYHHGDLGRALVEAAVRIIDAQGVDALTLRAVGQRLGVSRTAPYRHFDDKAALLAAVALEGFRMLRRDLEESLRAAEAGRQDPLTALSAAYVAFGAEHPSHYRTMFGIAWGDKGRYPALAQAGEATFHVLVGVIVRGQTDGRLVPGDPTRLARVVWSMVHGIVMLAGDDGFSRLPPGSEEDVPLATFAMATLSAGLVVRRRRGK